MALGAFTADTADTTDSGRAVTTAPVCHPKWAVLEHADPGGEMWGSQKDWDGCGSGGCVGWGEGKEASEER